MNRSDIDKLMDSKATRAIGILSVIIIVIVRLLRTISADVVGNKGTDLAGGSESVPREQFRGGASISASKTCRHAASVNRNVSLKSRSNSHLRGAIGASDWCSKEPPAALLISRRGQNVPGRPGARLPGRNNDGLSTSATVRHCSLLRHDRGGIEGTNWATEGRSHRTRELGDAPPCVHHFQSPHFTVQNRLGGTENGEDEFAGNR